MFSLSTIITFILVLAVLILVHEFGHFIAAKIIGVKVEEFGFGLPPRAIGKKIGETIYSLNWLPFGGFVKLYGEDGKDISKVREEKSRAFYAKQPILRVVVLTAGVIMNFILGWIIISFLFTQGVMMPGDRVYIEEIAVGSPAEQAGLQERDVVRAIKGPDGKEYSIKTPGELVDATNQYLGKEITLFVSRGRDKMEIVITPREEAPEDEGAMGVVISNYEEKQFPIYQAPFLGLKQSLSMMKDLVTGFSSLIWRLVTLQGVKEEIAGPVGIGQLIGQARQFGNNAVLELVAILSFNLALLNILPFPALDGGRLMFVVIEGATGKKINPAWEKSLHQIGMGLLLIGLLLITVNDILRLATG